MRLVLAGESCVGAEIVVPGRSGFSVLETAPTPSLTNTIASFFPIAAAAASAMSAFVRENAKRKLAGTHGAATAGTAGVVPALAAGGVDTQLVALFTVSWIAW